MAVVLKKSKEIVTEPLDVGEGKLSVVDVIARAEGAPVSAGVCEIWASAPVEFDYDNDCAVCYMLEGSVTLTEDGTRHDFEPGDVVFVPQQAGLKVSWDGLRTAGSLRDLSTLAVGRPQPRFRSVWPPRSRNPGHSRGKSAGSHRLHAINLMRSGFLPLDGEVSADREQPVGKVTTPSE